MAALWLVGGCSNEAPVEAELSVQLASAELADVPVSTMTFEGESMLPTITNGGRVEVRMTGPTLPGRGDIVVLSTYDGSGGERQLLKRVVALPGETIEIFQCQVYVDGAPLDEPYIDASLQQTNGCGSDQSALLVPEGAVFILGDNRGMSSDSRAFGPVSTELIVGIVQT
jgi:signal peptidase I